VHRSGIIRTLFKVIWRTTTGQPLDGRRRTDGTFRHAGRRSLDPSGRASRWSMRPGYERAGIRWAAGATLYAYAWGVRHHPVVTRVALVVALGALGWRWGRRGWRSWLRWRNARGVLAPLNVALCSLLGVARHPDEWITLPPNYRTDPESVVRVALPDEFTATTEARKTVAELVGSKLGGEWDPTFHMVGHPVLEMKKAPEPPKMVTFAEARSLFEAQPANAPLMAVGTRNSVLSVDLDSDAPHVLISMGTGGGKSVLGRSMAAQILHNGGRAVFLDLKRISHNWARDVPGASIHRSAEEIHRKLIALTEECRRRYLELDADESKQFQRVLIVAEEMNATMQRLQSYWESVREPDDPKKSPAVDGLLEILFTGRAAFMHVAGIAQMGTAKALGGPEGRENFGYRVLGRYSVQAWRMLAPEVWPMPRKSRRAGRVQVVFAGEAHAGQIPYLTPAEAREWATSGVTVTQPDQENEGVTVTPPNVVQLAQRWTLREAADAELVAGTDGKPMTYAALRKAKSRDPEFPAGVRQGDQDTYTEEELKRWAGNRVRAADRVG
jgi:hypothetical protein